MEPTVNDTKPTLTPPLANGERASFFNSVYADVLGGLLTLGAGIGTAFHVINKSFFGNLDTDNQKLKSVTARDTVRDKVHLNENWGKEIRAAEKGYTQGVKSELRERGIKNIFDKWGTLRSHQKWEAGLAIAAVTAVTLGAVSAYFGSRDTSRKLDNIQRRLDQQGDSPQP